MKRIIIAVIVFIFIQTAYAATPQLVDYQGYLMESGAAVTGTKNITFTLYDSASGGAQLCTSGAQSVAVTAGVFSYRIGSAGCNLSTINWDNPVYLELKVEGTTLSPRELVAGAAYSVQTKAMNVVFTPTGNVASTNVQSAITEIDNEKLDKTGGTITGALAVTGNLNASGTVTATNLSGDGTSVTNVTPKDSSVTSAKVADNSLTAADLNVNVVSSVDGVTNDGGNIDIVAGSGITVTPDDAANTITFAADVSVVDHNSLANLTAGDPHTQYAKKAGDTLTGDLNMGTHNITNAVTVAATNLSGDGTSVTNVTPKDDSVTSAKVADNSLTAADLNVNVVSSVDGVTNDGGNIDIVAGSGITITPDDTANTITLTADVSAVDHNSLANLTAGDPHTQYAKKAGDTLTGDLNMGTYDIMNAGTVAATNLSGDGTSVTNVTPKDDSVTSAKIADGAVGTSEVADGTLTAADLNVNVVSSVDGVTNDGGDIDLIAGSGVTITPDDGANTVTIAADMGSIDHGSIAGLGDDDHTQYVKDAGDTMTGALAMSTANGDITFDNAGGDITLAGGGISDSAGSVNINDNLSVTGTVGATSYTGDGSGLSGIITRNSTVNDASPVIALTQNGAGAGIYVGRYNTVGTDPMLGGDTNTQVPYLKFSYGGGVNYTVNYNGDVTTSGTVTAAYFSGDGTSVTNVTPKDDSVTSAKIADGAVGTSEVADGTLTAADLNVNVVSSVDGVTNDGGDIDLIAGSGVTITPDDGANTVTIAADVGAIDHGSIAGLGDDDHTQYVKDAGDTMTGTLAMSTASGDITFDNAGGDITLAGGSISDNAGNVNLNDNVSVTGTITAGSDTGSDGYDVNFYGTYNAVTGGRIFWDASKDAFRTGRDTGSNWSDANTGAYSFASGNDTIASGLISTAMGYNTIASGQYSTAMGYYATASGARSTAMGQSTTASGTASTAMGQSITASGTASTAMGAVATASGDYSLAAGEWVTAGTAANTITLGQGVSNVTQLVNNTASSLMVGFNSDVATLYVGPGSGAGTYGKVGIGTNSPSTTLDVAGTATVSGGASYGVYASTTGASPVAAVYGFASGTSAYGVRGTNAGGSGIGVLGESTGTGSAVYGFQNASGNVFSGNHTGGGGNLIQMQAGGVDKFTVDRSGNVTAAGTISGAGIDAGTLDSMDSTDFVAAAGDTMTGALAMSTASGDITFDNAGGDITLAGGSISDSTGNVNLNDNVSVSGTIAGAASSAGSALSANQTGAGDLFHLQSGGVDTFVVDNIGTLTLSRTSGNMHMVLKATGGNWQSAMSYKNSGGTSLWTLYNDIAAIGAQTFSIKDEVAGADRLTINPSGYVGIGTTSPKVKLDVAGNITASGTVSIGSNTGSDGYDVNFYGTLSAATGGRMYWDASKDAFRAGRDTGTNWSDANTGSYSFASGYDTKAIGNNSTAMGTNATASGDTSAAVGLATTASGNYSTAAGYYTTASGSYSMAIGRWVTAGTTNAITLGQGVSDGARLVNGTASSLMVGFNSDEPTLYVGPSSGAGTTGNVGIGTSSPTSKLYVLNSATSGNSAYFYNSNTGNATGKVVYALNAGGNGSRAGYFENNNAVNTACSLWANNTGGGEALCGEVNNTTSTSSAIKIGTTGDGKAASFSVTKATNTEDAVYISHDGVGSGTTAGLEVVTTNGAHAIYGHTTGATGRAGKFFIDNAANDNDVLYIETASTVGGTTLGRLIDTNKGAYLTNTGIWTDASSRQYKKDITPLTNDDVRDMLDVVKGIQVVRYRYKEEAPATRMTLGVIAEDAPDEMTDDTKTGVQTVKAVGMLIAAMQAQQELIDGLQKEVDDLKKAQNDSCVK